MTLYRIINAILRLVTPVQGANMPLVMPQYYYTTDAQLSDLAVLEVECTGVLLTNRFGRNKRRVSTD